MIVSGCKFLPRIAAPFQRYVSSTTVRCSVNIEPEEATQTETVVWVPKRFGKNKARISMNEVIKKSNAIIISHNKAGEIPLIITGTVEACADARTNIERLIADYNGEQTQTSISVPMAYYGRIIGKKGTNIAKLRGDTDTFITVEEENDEKALVTIKGLPENCVAALEAIQAITDPSDHVISENIILIPEAKVGVLLGKKGWSIKKIMQKSRAKISIDTSSVSKDGFFEVTVKGQNEKCSAATKMIEDLIESAPY